MAEEIFRGQQYKLRASAPMPVAQGYFVLHTFGAEINDIDIFNCTQTLPSSADFRGQGLDGGLVSANFSRLGDRTGDYYQGRQVYSPQYVDEDELDFNF